MPYITLKQIRRTKTFAVAAVIAVLAGAGMMVTYRKPVDFMADVKPIINKKCISCHGGVKAKAGFSLLFREDALAPTESGKPAIIPGNPEASEMILRLVSTDPEKRMPYHHQPLSTQEINTLKRWIKEGAKWETHWAYLPVPETKVPDIRHPFIVNEIDAFIVDKLKGSGLQPSAQADKASLLRRVSLDLTGMYPDSVTANAFLGSRDSSAAYERLVDALLASPGYGERWASVWLDIARYADTKGYESDIGRNIWRYRDWVIQAFNADMPYDRFLTEQIAGDLLPNTTDAQYLATAFHRNSMTNDEGGTSNEEFRTAAVIDRVNTTWEGLMGTTFACVQCHSHPYDPFRHEEYYRFMAFFNNTADEDVPPEYPLLRHFSDSPHLKNKLDDLLQWVHRANDADAASYIGKFLKTGQPSIHSALAEEVANCAIGNKNYALFFRNNAIARFRQVDLEATDQLIFRYDARIPGGTMEIRLDSINGPVLTQWKVIPAGGYQPVAVSYTQQQGKHDVYVSYRNPAAPQKEDFILFFDWLHFGKQFPGQHLPEYARYRNLFFELLNAPLPATPVMVEKQAGSSRQSYVFERGAWTAKGKAVQPAVPELLSYAMPSGAPPNRLGVAMWMTDKKHPLVSRTMVNRLWEQLFGTGLAETLEDLGTQGILPTHRELLDYLAYSFMHRYNWSIRKMLKTMVMSATYRQTSARPQEANEKDPFNRLYARGPRVRLSAEQLRDQALCISGTLNAKMYGPPVMPWQPPGIWLSPYNGAQWQTSSGLDQYRRAVYTYWKRTAPYPAMITFDAAQRVVCSARRIRTNTPLQALATLNDSTMFDMARNFALRMKKEGGRAPEAQIRKGYESMLFRKIPKPSLDAMMKLYHTSKEILVKNKTDREKLAGATGTDAETAALVVVANALLNLDEVMMK